MATGYVGFDPSAPAGTKFKSSAVREEIAELATGDPGPGGVDTTNLADNAVTRDKIADDAVGPDELDAGAVETANIATDAVTADKIADDAVGPDQAGTGIVTAYDKDGNAVSIKLVKMTAAQYSALGSKDPNTYYFVSA